MENLGLYLFGIAILFQIYGIIFHGKKSKEYNSDERWKLILSESDNIAMSTFYLIAAIAFVIKYLGSVNILFFKSLDSQYNILETFFMIAVLLVPISKLIAMKIYDKRY